MRRNRPGHLCKRSRIMARGPPLDSEEGQDLSREYHLLTKYGINQDVYNEMLEAQNGVCAICGWENTGRSLNVDHCHATGRVRGLLCNRCNLGLGYYWSDPELLRKAADYLGDGFE